MSTAGGDQTHPDVSAGGSQYLVVWEDTRAGFPQQDIYASRVNAFGGVLDAGGIAVDTASNLHRANPAVAYDGTNFLVTWEETFGQKIDARLVSSSGVAAAAGVQEISSKGGFPESVGVVASSYGWYVVWDGSFESTFHILGNPEVPAANGPAADQLVSGVAPQQGSPDVVEYFVGEFFIVWTDFRNGSDYDVYGTFVNTFGQVFDQDGRAISTAPGNQLDPKVAFDPDQLQLLTVWSDFRNGVHGDVYGARIGSDESSNLPIADVVERRGRARRHLRQRQLLRRLVRRRDLSQQCVPGVRRARASQRRSTARSRRVPDESARRRTRSRRRATLRRWRCRRAASPSRGRTTAGPPGHLRCPSTRAAS